MPAPHRIFRCTFEVLGAQRDAFTDWRRRARTLWMDQFAPCLETELDEVAAAMGNDRVVRMPRLEVEVHVARGTDPVAVRELFHRALVDRLRETTSGLHIPARPLTSPAPEPAGEDRWLEAWLLTGIIPWWGGKPAPDRIGSALLEVLKAASGAAWFRAILSRQPRAARRVALQFDQAWQVATLVAAWPSGWPEATPFVEAAVRLASLALAGAAPERTSDVWESCWRWWARAIPPSVPLQRAALLAADSPDPELLRRFRDALGLEIDGSVQPAPVQVPEAPSPRPDRDPALPVASDTEAALSTSLNADGKGPPFDPRGSFRGSSSLPDETLPPGGPGTHPRGAPPAPATRRTPVGPQSQGPHVDADTRPSSTPALQADVAAALLPGLPVANAGVVIAAPLLPHFLDRIGIRLSPNPADRRGADLAPLLLHFLATGMSRASEPELALAKLLCGLPFEDPVVCHHEIPGEIVGEAERLLNSVIEHWGALGKTSPRGLRDGFLQRPGVLRDAGAHWQLRVEHRAWDILIDRVPWTFRTVLLPWMPKPLIVDWEART